MEIIQEIRQFPSGSTTCLKQKEDRRNIIIKFQNIWGESTFKHFQRDNKLNTKG